MRGRPADALLVLGLVAAAGIVVLNAVRLFATGYAQVAERHLGSAVLARDHGAHLAATIKPWDSAHAARTGWIQADTGNAAGARDAYARALRLAPSDAHLWTEYTLALGRLALFDGAANLAVARARALAPASPTIRSSIVRHGLTYWNRGGPQLREAWLAAMRDELKLRRAAFLSNVVTLGRTSTFCQDIAPRLGERAWCDSMATRLDDGCYDTTTHGPAPCRGLP